jgi:hypothetical protein
MIRAMARLQRFALLLMPLGILFFARPAAAAPPWVDRPITLPRLVFAGDAGLGIATVHLPRAADPLGAGLNLEAALGITDSVELGLRTGFRFGDEARAIGGPDTFGRTLDTETYGVNNGVVANPELHVRWSFYSGRVVEAGLDGRLYVPVEDDSDVGIMMGLPLAFHVGGFMRIDTGVYVPVIFTGPASSVISVPVDLWFQVSRQVWLGPMAGFRHVDPGGPPLAHDDLLLGFGLGYQVASAVDLKWQLYTPRINGSGNDVRAYGAGMGVQFRIGE